MEPMLPCTALYLLIRVTFSTPTPVRKSNLELSTRMVDDSLMTPQLATSQFAVPLEVMDKGPSQIPWPFSRKRPDEDIACGVLR
jgi:hypothetical protein